MQSSIYRFYKPKLLLLIFISSLSLMQSCQRFPLQYKLNIEQGNIIDQAKVNQLKIGMTGEQVKFLLGTPVMVNIFNPQEWIYYYKLIDNSNTVVKNYKLNLRFNAENLVENISIDKTSKQVEPENSLQKPSAQELFIEHLNRI